MINTGSNFGSFYWGVNREKFKENCGGGILKGILEKEGMFKAQV